MQFHVLIMREYRSFSFKNANFRISTDKFDLLTTAIIKLRTELENYIMIHPAFQTAMQPISLLENAPPIAVHMAQAATAAGVGPMAAVAGAIAQLSAEIAISHGAKETIVENGGDIFVYAQNPVMVGIYSGSGILKDKLALQIMPHDTPIAICASSGKMGRSFSYGKCELAIVTSHNACLADTAATATANYVKKTEDIKLALSKAISIKGVLGVIIIHEGMVGIAGNIPSLVKNPQGLQTNLITGFSLNSK